MANKIMGITIDIEGKTSGLTKSLQDANTAISKTTSALKDVDKALQLDPTNVELMAQKQALLEKQIVQTSEKLDVMKQVADDANEALARGDISQEQYASLTAELTKTDAALAQLQSEAEANADAMNGVSDGAEDAAEDVGDLGDESEDTGGALTALEGVAIAVGAAMATAFAATIEGAKEVTKALVDSTLETSEFADEMLTMSSVTGLSTDRLQELTYASELLDVDVNTITGSMTKMEKTMSSAATQNEKYEEKMAELNAQLAEGKISQEEWAAAAEEAEAATVTAYDKIGVAIQNADGSFRSADDVFWDTIDALGQIEDPVERDLMAMELMGKSAKELNPLIEAGSASFRELADEAHETGYVMSEDTLDAFGAFDDQMQRFNNATDNVKHSLGGVLLPILGDLAGEGTDLLNDFAKAMQGTDGDLDKMADVMGEMIPKVINAITKQLPKLVGVIAKVVPKLVDTLVDNLPLILDAAMQILTVLSNSLLAPENLAKIVSAAVTIMMQLVQMLIQNLPLIIDAAIQIIVALINGLTQAIPQLIPTIIEAVLTIVNTLIDNMPLLLDATLQLILAVAGAILENLPEIISAVFEIITGVTGYLLGPDGIGQIVETGYKLLVSLVEKLPEALVEIIKGISGIVDDILKAFGFDEGLGKGLTEIWDGIWSMIKGVINTVIGGINGMISAVESAINFVIDCINTLSWDIPSWVPVIGGDTFGFDIPNVSFYKIPELATGAVIPPNNPFLAVLGDQTSGVNIEAPLETIKNALVDAMREQGNLGLVHVTAYFGDECVGTVVANANRNNNYISGGR